MPPKKVPNTTPKISASTNSLVIYIGWRKTIANTSVFSGGSRIRHIGKCWIGNVSHIRGFPCRQRGRICQGSAWFVHFRNVACNTRMYGRVDSRCCPHRRRWVSEDPFSTKMSIAVVWDASHKQARCVQRCATIESWLLLTVVDSCTICPSGLSRKSPITADIALRVTHARNPRSQSNWHEIGPRIVCREFVHVDRTFYRHGHWNFRLFDGANVFVQLSGTSSHDPIGSV